MIVGIVLASCLVAAWAALFWWGSTAFRGVREFELHPGSVADLSGSGATLRAVAAAPQVHLDEAADSGFANIVQQYLQQSLDESEKRRRRARQLRGRMAMIATDHGQTVTLVFTGDEVAIQDGERGPLDASIRGAYPTLVDLIQGEASPLVSHLTGRIKVTSSFSKPFFPLHVHNLMKLEPEPESVDYLTVREAALLVTAAILASVTTVYTAW